MIGLLLILIIPAILCVLPFIALLFLVDIKILKDSALKTGITALGLTALNIVTSISAMSLSIYGMTRNQPEGDPQCVTGAPFFIMLGILFTLLTLVFGIVYTYRNYKNLLN